MVFLRFWVEEGGGGRVSDSSARIRRRTSGKASNSLYIGFLLCAGRVGMPKSV